MNTTERTTRETIIELAQEAIASKGYSAFSFRELATQLGIKSASIHYHFPTKADLGLAVAQTYRRAFEECLQQCAEQGKNGRQKLQALIGVYREEVAASMRMTVCIMLSAESENLPTDIAEEMRSFYQVNLEWLQAAFAEMGIDRKQAKVQSAQLMALLQGGLIGAKTQRNPQYFDQVMKATDKLLL